MKTKAPQRYEVVDSLNADEESMRFEKIKDLTTGLYGFLTFPLKRLTSLRTLTLNLGLYNPPDVVTTCFMLVELAPLHRLTLQGGQDFTFAMAHALMQLKRHDLVLHVDLVAFKSIPAWYKPEKFKRTRKHNTVSLKFF
jgi:hypothetical protein